MFLGKRIKELREQKELLQRQLDAELEIDTPMYRKIERRGRKAKRVQVIKLAELFDADEKELLSLWLAGLVYEIFKNEKISQNAIDYVNTYLKS